MSRPTKSFWVSFPSILVGIEAVITAVTGLYVLLRERPPESNSKLVLKSPLKVRSLLNPEVDEVIRQTAENAGISVLIDGSVDQGSRDTLDQLRQTHESRRPDVAIGGSCQVYGTFTDWEEYLERIPDGFAAHQAISPHYVSEHWVGWYRGYLAFAYCRNKWDLDESMSWLDLESVSPLVESRAAVR